MKFELQEHRELIGIPSASGMEITETGVYVIGDDSPWLFRLNDNYEIAEKIPLFPTRDFSDSIIEKIHKPDLEAIAKGNYEGTKLLAFGSGSKSPERDVMVEIDLSAKVTTEYSLVDFYSNLRTEAGLAVEDLNIEAAEVYEDQLYLFNRGRNLIINCKLTDFFAFVNGGEQMPELEIFQIELPEINGVLSGFSDASVDPVNGILFFTATVENTDNWYDDGEVLGSFIGIIDLKDPEDGMKPENIGILKDKAPLKIKVESIAVIPPFKKNQADLLLMTDSDGGVSELLLGTLLFTQDKK